MANLTKFYVKKSVHDDLKKQHTAQLGNYVKKENMNKVILRLAEEQKNLAAEKKKYAELQSKMANSHGGLAGKLARASDTIRKQQEIISKLQNLPINAHPQYEQLMDQYAEKDNTTCPTSYKPCKPCPKVVLSEHPEIHRYILKTEIPSIISNEAPIERHPDFHQYIHKSKLAEMIKAREAEQSETRIADIGDHPDIHRYILKSQIPAMIDKECRKHFSKEGAARKCN